MSKVLKAVLICAYCTVVIHLFKSAIMDKNYEIVEINYQIRTPREYKRMQRAIRQHKINLSDILSNFTRPERLPTDLKFILKYTKAFLHYSSSIHKDGQAAFIENNCTYYNCLLTNNKNMFIDIRNFDAILFDVENNWDTHPIIRSPHQKYIFTASESADMFPICDENIEGYYNWTWTYKLDSDIRWSYITVTDKFGNTVGPNINMRWLQFMNPISEDIKKILGTKKKAAAWFVSNCNRVKSKREAISQGIQEALAKHGMGVDVYGACGNLTCSRDRMKDCLEIVQEDYYFYLVFENSLSQDYVTEKLLYPLQYYTVPIVYGGADYTRFLPPGSYIDAGKLDAKTVVGLMVDAIQNKETYYNFFRWHNHYEFKQSPKTADVCTLCQLLNEKQDEVTIIRNFRKWWNPDYKTLCKVEPPQKIVLI